MNLTDAVSEFGSLLEDKQKAQLTPGCVWAVVSSVDWDAKTMTAVGVEDDLEYYNIQLGLGAYYRNPIVGSKVLLGVPGLQDSDTFLIECEAFTEAVFTSGDSTFIIKEDGFVVKQASENLRTVLLDFMAECKKIVVVNGTTINQPAVTLIEERLKTILKED